jgi:hypothetical protein
MPHRDFLETARAEKSDVTLQALCDRLLAERGVKADTSMMSRFFGRIGVHVSLPPTLDQAGWTCPENCGPAPNAGPPMGEFPVL